VKLDIQIGDNINDGEEKEIFIHIAKLTKIKLN